MTNRSIGVDYPYIIALLPNKTIEIHSMASPTLSIVAVIPCPTTLQSSFLSHSVTAYLVPSLQRHNALKATYVSLLKLPTPSGDPTSGSGLTPPPTPAKPPSIDRSISGRSSRNNANLTPSGSLVAGAVGIHALLPSTLVSQIDSLMEGSRIDDAIELVSQATERMQRAGGVTDEGSVRLHLHMLAFVDTVPPPDAGDIVDPPTNCFSTLVCYSLRRRW